MYVCLCNGITERDAEQAVASGARKPAHVHAKLGARPQCGRCTSTLKEMLGRAADRQSSGSPRQRNSLA